MNQRPITAKQQEVLDAIGLYTREHGYPPSIRELMRALNIKSPNGVCDHIKALVRKGALAPREPMASRALSAPGSSVRAALGVMERAKKMHAAACARVEEMRAQRPPPPFYIAAESEGIRAALAALLEDDDAKRARLLANREWLS